MSPVKSEVQLRVRYSETDQMGVVHHANYIVWFEAARSALFRQLGHPYTAIEERGYVSPVVEAECRYLAPARYDELVSVTAELENLTPARVSFHYRVTSDGRLLAEGKTVHAFTDRCGRPVNIKKTLPELWERFREVS